MLFGLLTFFVALIISSVAIYYSVAGLVAIFAAAAVPIIIMGTALEVGKLVTAVWLHRYWSRATWWLKTYLSIAVVVLMLITSMGIFGFLSKAHVEQNLASDTVTSRIEILEGKILAEEKYIERQNQVLLRIQNKDDSGVNRFNQDIAIEQKKIDDAYARIEVLDADVEAFTSRNKGFGGTGRVKQGLELREKQGPEREALMLQIEKASQKIDELRAKNDASLDGIEAQIQIAEKNIFDATGRIDEHLLAIEPLKGQVMKLESEVGPIRYIAEFVYGEEADRNLLEEAVRWVIITIIFVFDPLAVLLIICANMTLSKPKKMKTAVNVADDWKDIEVETDEEVEEEIIAVDDIDPNATVEVVEMDIKDEVDFESETTLDRFIEEDWDEKIIDDWEEPLYDDPAVNTREQQNREALIRNGTFGPNRSVTAYGNNDPKSVDKS